MSNEGGKYRGDKPLNEPFMGAARCSACHCQWTSFLPDGTEDMKSLECPNCHEMKGCLVNHLAEFPESTGGFPND